MIQDFERTTTERLLLRRLQEGDLDAVFTLHGDSETNEPSLRVAERLGMRRDRVIDYEGAASAVYLMT